VTQAADVTFVKEEEEEEDQEEEQIDVINSDNEANGMETNPALQQNEDVDINSRETVAEKTPAQQQQPQQLQQQQQQKFVVLSYCLFFLFSFHVFQLSYIYSKPTERLHVFPRRKHFPPHPHSRALASHKPHWLCSKPPPTL
jgi:hypothetical protein